MKYVWDGLDRSFVANPFRKVWPGKVVPVSVLGGAQVEHLLTIFQSPTGDFWIAYDQDLLGYYPASLFTLLKDGACEARWYGEVYNPHPEKKEPFKTEMGSGKHAEVGRPNVAYVRNPRYYDPFWFSVEPQGNLYTTPVVDACYTRSPLEPDPVSGGHLFTLGGPGGKEEKCAWPSP